MSPKFDLPRDLFALGDIYHYRRNRRTMRRRLEIGEFAPPTAAETREAKAEVWKRIQAARGGDAD